MLNKFSVSNIDRFSSNFENSVLGLVKTNNRKNFFCHGHSGLINVSFTLSWKLSVGNMIGNYQWNEDS